MKKKKKRKGKELTKIKKIIYALVIGFAVISFWRGIWGLWDAYVFPRNYTMCFPSNYPLSLWISVVVGLVILLLTHKIIRELM